MSDKKKTVIQWVVAVVVILAVIGGTAALFLWFNSQSPDTNDSAEVTEQLEPGNALLLLADPMTASGSVELPEGQSLVIAEKGDNLNFLSQDWDVTEVQEGLTVITTEAQRAAGEPYVIELAEAGSYGFTLVNESESRAYQVTVTRDAVPTEEAPEVAETPAP